MPKRKITVTLARPRTIKAIVSHPRLAGEREQVERVVTLLDGILRRARLEPRGIAAAQRYARARERVYGGAGGAMDFERISGHGWANKLPPYMEAAEILRQARWGSAPLDYAIIDLVIGHSMTILQASKIIYRREADRNRKFVGERFRIGLNVLADLWFPAGKERKSHAHIEPDGHAGVTDSEQIKPGQVYHAA